MVAARGGYGRLDRRLRGWHPWLRGWHVLVTVVLGLVGVAVVLVVIFQPVRTVCRGPAHLAATPAAQPVGVEAARRFAEQFAPIFVFSRRETFFPIPPERFVQLSDLYRVEGRQSPMREEHYGTNRTTLPTKPCGTNCRQYLDIRNAPRKRYHPARPYRLLQQTKLADAPAVVGYRVLRYDTRPTALSVQYWLLSLFNSLVGDFHEGDLEEVTVHAQADGHVEDVFYSEHVAGTVRTWGTGVEAQGARAVAYVARGSHANYFTTGVKRTVAHCPARHGEEDVVCDDFGGVAADHADGCGEAWTWAGAGGVEAPRSWGSCGRSGREARRVVRYELRLWVGHPVEWGAPKKSFGRKPGWVDDPSMRGQLWTNALAKIRRNACYAIDED
jgi:hypothetical protein